MSKKLIGGLMVLLVSLGMSSMANAQCWHRAPRHRVSSVVLNAGVGGFGVGFYSGPARVYRSPVVYRAPVMYRAVPVYDNSYYGAYPQGNSCNQGACNNGYGNNCNNNANCNNGYGANYNNGYSNNCNNNANCNNGYGYQNTYNGYYQQ